MKTLYRVIGAGEHIGIDECDFDVDVALRLPSHTTWRPSKNAAMDVYIRRQKLMIQEAKIAKAEAEASLEMARHLVSRLNLISCIDRPRPVVSIVEQDAVWKRWMEHCLSENCISCTSTERINS